MTNSINHHRQAPSIARNNDDLSTLSAHTSRQELLSINDSVEQLAHKLLDASLISTPSNTSIATSNPSIGTLLESYSSTTPPLTDEESPSFPQALIARPQAFAADLSTVSERDSQHLSNGLQGIPRNDDNGGIPRIIYVRHNPSENTSSNDAPARPFQP